MHLKTKNDTQEAVGKFTVINDRGLHTRPSTEIVKCASSFQSDVRLKYRKMEVNAKSILGILMLAAAKGAKVSVLASGKDAKEAVNALVNLANKQFNIKY